MNTKLRYQVAEEERERQYRAAEFAQDFERPPGATPTRRDNAPVPKLKTAAALRVQDLEGRTL